MRKTILLISAAVLFASILACSLPFVFGPRLIVTLAPAPGLPPQDITFLRSARDVLVRRLNSVGLGNATVTLTLSSEGTFLVSLPGSADLEAITPLITEMGYLVFVDSTSPLPAGASVDASLEVVLTGADIKSAEVPRNNSGNYIIAIKFTPEGAQKMADYSSKNIGHYLVIARDGVVISSPTVNAAITDGKAIIAGSFTFESANTLVVLLRSGCLPFPLVILKTETK
jgi:preprotein translocase subunit SecD